ncbi:MAG: hypothetical protein V6Z86_05960 [Hyphomicrobiales bacterium]
MNTRSEWLAVSDLAELAGIAKQNAQKALAKRRWRGCDLLVRQIEVGRGGAGGKAPQVHIDTLPGELRQAWYLKRGIDPRARPEAGEAGAVEVTQPKIERDGGFARNLDRAQWRLDIIRPALAHPKGSGKRGAAIKALAAASHRDRRGRSVEVSLPTLYNWIAAAEADRAGLAGLLRDARADRGRPRVIVTRRWDRFFGPHISAADHRQTGEALTHYIRSLWASGECGRRAICEKSTTRLIELSRDLGVASFGGLPSGYSRQGRRSATTQYGLCRVSGWRVAAEGAYRAIAIKRRDNATWQDRHMPSIRRDYSDLAPRDIVVGDVHPTDVMMLRPDGKPAYPKAITWLDVATHEIHMTFALLEKGEGVRQEHIAQAFSAMIDDWGLPKLLYLDNGTEYSSPELVAGFTRLSKLTSGAIALDLGGAGEVGLRVAASREAVIRSTPYNARGKPRIEGAFGNLERVHFSLIPGWTAGERMRKKTHAKGKTPIAFSGDETAFLEAARLQLDWYHQRPQQGHLNGKSPNEALRGYIDQGWAGKRALKSPQVIDLAFAKEIKRTPHHGRVRVVIKRGDGPIWYYHDKLVHYHTPITLHVPAHNPSCAWCFAGEELICVARPEQTYGVLDPAGLREGDRRRKALNRDISEMRKHCALLSLQDETARHVSHLPDGPEVPIGAMVDAGMLDRLAEATEAEIKSLAHEREKRRPLALDPNIQFGMDPGQAMRDWQGFAPEKEEASA